MWGQHNFELFWKHRRSHIKMSGGMTNDTKHFNTCWRHSRNINLVYSSTQILRMRKWSCYLRGNALFLGTSDWFTDHDNLIQRYPGQYQTSISMIWIKSIHFKPSDIPNMHAYTRNSGVFTENYRLPYTAILYPPVLDQSSADWADFISKWRRSSSPCRAHMAWSGDYRRMHVQDQTKCKQLALCKIGRK